ncbi:MAG: aminoacyl-tRNA hydrolase [Acidimicrobiia bacterium]
MLVVVGLRNPESQYIGTRHNIGAEVVRALASRHAIKFKRGPRRVRNEIASLSIGHHKIVLGLPKSSMNLSGRAVAPLLRYFKAAPEDLLVCHDDIDLAFARLRLQFGRGSGGHNGVQSVVEALGSQDFHRLRIGVGRPPGNMDPADHVLRPFMRSERQEADFLVQDGVDVIERFVDDREAAVRMASERRG